MGDPLSVTASVIAVLQLAASATGYLRSIRDGAADRVKLRDELRSAIYLLETLRDRIEDAEDAAGTLDIRNPILIKSLAGLDSPLILFQRMLEDIIAKLHRDHKLRQLSLPLIWPFTKKDVAEKLACMERLKSHISLVMQNDLVQLAQSSHRKIIDMEQKVDHAHLRDQEDQRQKIFLWLSTLSFHEQHAAILESVQAGTGGWFIKHETLQSWLEGKINMLWCPGIPGAGKTRLMSIVVDTLMHKLTLKNSLHTYIYCNYDRRKEQTPAALLSNLLLQVLQNSTKDTVPSEVLSLYNSHKKYGTRPTSKELTNLLTKVTSVYETLFVVIDALDELNESEEDALRFLSTIRSVGSNIKILCSSRFSTTFEAYFASTRKVEIFARNEDIEMFLNSEISQQPRLSKHVRADPNLRKDIIASITEECQGMFLLSKLHLESLSTKINRKAVRSALSTLPGTLDDTYSEALRRIYDQPADTVDLAETVLFWVVCAHQSLTVMQLQHMYAARELTEDMALENDDLPDGEILTAACGGLITVNSESQTIHVIHYTAQQYFERSLGQKLMTARMSLAKVSLTYLALPNFSSGYCTSDKDMLQRLIEYPFLDYAAKHWGSDMNLLDVDELLPDLERLLSNTIVVEMISQVWNLPSARYHNWSQEFPRRSPAVVLAAAFDLPVILRWAIANGHDIECRGTDNVTALIRAAEFGYAENVRVLLQLGAAVNTKDYMGETALQKAARNGHGGVIRVLIDEGADVNNKGSSNLTSLMSAVSSGNIDVVRMLVEAGAELMTETEWGDTALSMAVRSGQEPIATFLADNGAVLPHGVVGRRAFVVASQRGLQRLVRRLTIDYEAVAGKPLQRQSSRIMSGIPASLQGTPSDSQTEAQGINEVSIGELIEQYNIKTNFHQQYHIMEQVEKGHFATVHICSNRVTGVVFAVKRFKSSKPLTASNFEDLSNEIQLFRELQRNYHTNLNRLVDVFSDFKMNEIRLVLDLAAEGELFNAIVTRVKFTEAETRTIFTQLLSAIQFLHDHGWVHRDIKPENILVMDKNLTIQLGDFGLARKIRTGSVDFDELATTLCGTPSYVAPEILEDYRRRRYGFGVDIWSSGVVLYICLCGFPPFSDELCTKENPYNLAQQIKMGRFGYPSPYWDPVGDITLDLIDRMMTVDPTKRISASGCLSHPWISGIHPGIK